MQVSLNFDSKQILRIERRYADTLHLHLPEAVKRSLLEGQTKARTEIIKNVRPLYAGRAVTRKEIADAIDASTKIRLRGHVNDMVVHMKMPDRSFTLKRFVDGPKKPRRQKGVKIRDRKKIVVQIQPGVKTTLPHAFIAKGAGELKNAIKGDTTNYQVFRRKGVSGGGWSGKMRKGGRNVSKEGRSGRGGRGVMATMATPSIATYAEKFLHSKVAPIVADKMQKSFTRNLRNLSKTFS